MAKKKIRRKHKEIEDFFDNEFGSDDIFSFIVGYTDSGVPYGTTWEEIGIDSNLPYDEKIRLQEEMENTQNPLKDIEDFLF